jgi:hypothetical protein
MADAKPTEPPMGEPPISILALSDVHLQMLRALQAAVRILDAWDHLTIVGGLGRFFGGTTRRVGDLDVLIAEPICKRYWAFLEVLSYHGIISLFDVIDRPEYPWRYVRPHPLVAHARALTLESLAGQEHAKLDICLKADDLEAIPFSDKWIREGDIQKYKDFKTDQERADYIAPLYKEFKDERKREEQTPANVRRHPDLKLLYAW